MTPAKRIVLFGSSRWLPNQLPNLAAWYRFNQGITDAAGAVSQWDDASGNARHLLQATGANQPAKQGDGSILFDGTSDFLKTAPFTFPQPATVIIFGKQITWTNNDRWCDGNTLDSGTIYQSTTTPLLSTYAGGVVGTVSLALNTYAALFVVLNGASSLIQVNDGTPASGDAGAANLGGFVIGVGGNSLGTFSHIHIEEIILCAAALTAPERAQIYAYGQAQGYVV